MAEKKKEPSSIAVDEKSGVTRREVIKLGAGAAITAAVVGLDSPVLAESSQATAPLFFTKEEFARWMFAKGEASGELPV